ncbi:MAG: WecB/TagA/CpsF family glycosyltransferase, partial [Chloroflexi bacterium]|nr:WecB/TagA/CpsF family glycosyltransferase [Chloroflexota bacterium]
APRWIQHIGLEWLHRLIQQPWRWKRMMALPRFAIAVIREA